MRCPKAPGGVISTVLEVGQVSPLKPVPSDQPALSQMSEVARELFQSIGLKVNYQAMDWGTVVTRRASQNPVDQGGWGAFITVMSPLTAANIAQYEADLANPGRVYADPVRRAAYILLFRRRDLRDDRARAWAG